jgi:hypothetical protein
MHQEGLDTNVYKVVDVFVRDHVMDGSVLAMMPVMTRALNPSITQCH